MRGALKPFAGLEIMDLKAGETKFKVKYDASKHELDKILAALKEAKEPATKID